MLESTYAASFSGAAAVKHCVGWEPEVLEGGKKALYITKEVCVDAGPEREGISTVPEVGAALENAGFDVHCYGNMVLGKK